ncbi:S1/P1 nuclease [Rhizobium ruizarguesonis]|uniref:S1/P1 nuclease n=1 Tax=Rhizobium leguminosarum TaxID=384 RepID=UPI0028C4B803|nr:S1/P1 nuclease [Rhizobium leguminosarum]
MSDPQVWAQGSFELAKKFAYAAPVLSGPTPELTREYETQARTAAEAQISLAAARLANLLNSSFGN